MEPSIGQHLVFHQNLRQQPGHSGLGRAGVPGEGHVQGRHGAGHTLGRKQFLRLGVVQDLIRHSFDPLQPHQLLEMPIGVPFGLPGGSQIPGGGHVGILRIDPAAQEAVVPAPVPLVQLRPAEAGPAVQAPVKGPVPRHPVLFRPSSEIGPGLLRCGGLLPEFHQHRALQLLEQGLPGLRSSCRQADHQLEAVPEEVEAIRQQLDAVQVAFGKGVAPFHLPRHHDQGAVGSVAADLGHIHEALYIIQIADAVPPAL